MKLPAVSPPVLPSALRLAIALGCSLSCSLGWSLSASAQTIQNIDTAPNDTFGDRVIVDPGVTRIFGVLESPTIPDVDYTTDVTIERGEVNNFVISDLPASEPFFVWMDTGAYSMSTSLGLFEPSGDLIRIPLPPLTEERRREMVKVASAEGENGKVAVRNIRRDANSDFKTLLKEKEITEDDEKRMLKDTQDVTDGFIKQIDELLAAKEKDIMEV